MQESLVNLGSSALVTLKFLRFALILMLLELLEEGLRFVLEGLELVLGHVLIFLNLNLGQRGRILAEL